MSVCTRGAAKTTRSSSGIQLSICLGKERKQGPKERERLWGAGGGQTGHRTQLMLFQLSTFPRFLQCSPFVDFRAINMSNGLPK